MSAESPPRISRFGRLGVALACSVCRSGSGPSPHTSTGLTEKGESAESWMVWKVWMAPLLVPLVRSLFSSSPKFPLEPPRARESELSIWKFSSLPVEWKTAIFGSIENRKHSPLPTQPPSVLHQEVE